MIVLRALFLVCLGTILYDTSVSAQRSFECELVWSGPSADNDIFTCLSDSKRIMKQMKYFSLAIVCGVLLVLLIAAIPFVCCACCHCCCFRRKTLEEHVEACDSAETAKMVDHYLIERKFTRTKTLLFSIAICIALATVLLCLVFGSVMVRSGVNHALSAIVSGPLAYINRVRVAVQRLLVDHSEDPSETKLDFSSFDQIRDGIRDGVNEVNEMYLKYMNMVVAVSIAVGVAGLTFGVMTLLGSIVQCPSFFPVLLGSAAYVIAIIYMILAIFMSVLAVFLSGLCGEVVLQYERVPGISQWYFLPAVAHSVDLESLRSGIQDAIRTAMYAFCAGVVEYCKEGARSGDTDYFTCGGIHDPSECVSVDFVFDQVIPNLVLLPAVQPLCPAPADVNEDEWVCSIHNCTEMCTDSGIQSAAKYVVDKAHYVANVSTAMSYLMPMLNVNYLVDIVSSIMESPPTFSTAIYSHPDNVNCSQLKGASWMMAAGFFIGSVSFFTILIVLLCVRNSWRDTAHFKGKQSPFQSTASSSQSKRYSDTSDDPVEPRSE